MREIQESRKGVETGVGESVIEYGQPVEASFVNPAARRSVFLGLGPLIVVLLLVGLSFLPLARVAMEVAEWGLLFAWFGSATMAIALGAMGYHRARTPGVGGRLLAVVGIVFGGLGLLVLGGFGYMHMQLDALYGRTGAVTMRHCSEQLEVIGWACADYAAKHGGQFPSSVVELYAQGGLNATNFVCPASRDTAAPGGSAGEVGANLLKAGHNSYVYVGGGLTTASPATAVLAYEKPENHGGGIHVLYVDGTVRWVPARTAATMISGMGSRAK